jgi:AcrR family transcriptional regulator
MTTKDRLLDAAEQLFGDKGITATSLRDVTALADANLASVNYHFGCKDALLAAVFERRFRPMNDRRLETLGRFEAAAGDGPVTLEEILWAWLEPPFHMRHESGDAGERYMRVVSRVYADPNHSIHELFLRQFETVRERFHDAFSGAMPTVSAYEITRRMHYCIGSLAHTFCWCQQIPSLCSTAEPHSDEVLHSLIAFAAAGMGATADLELPPRLFDGAAVSEVPS